MLNFDEIFERIKLATRTRTQLELANVLDIRQSSISDAKRRNSIPSDWCLKLFDRFGLNPDWVKKGIGPMYLKTETGYAPVDTELPVVAMEDASFYSDPNTKNVVMDVFSMQWEHEAAGQEPKKSGFKLMGKISIPLPLAGEGVRVFHLDNTSMEPYLRKGAHIGVDTTQKQIVSGELHAVYLPYEGVGIKRIFSDITKAQAILRAENPQHPEMTIPLESLGDAIIGRVVWAISKY